MIDLAEPSAMRAWSRARRAAGRRIALVPTMGFLHEGHLRLVDRARQIADDVVVSIFVNPLQFAPSDDFDRYPRDIARDTRLAEGRGVASLFVPMPASMYPREPAVRITPGRLAAHLCGPWRPGHFEGVLTVVAKLFHIVEPDAAVFGRKDAQQATIIHRMARELDFAIEILVAPTVREADGLAFSSRNAYLAPDDRRVAPVIGGALSAAHAAFRKGVTDTASLMAEVRGVVERESRIRIEYIEAVDPAELQPVARAESDTLLAIAVRLGGTRLIDNIVLGDGLAADDWVSSGTPGA